MGFLFIIFTVIIGLASFMAGFGSQSNTQTGTSGFPTESCIEEGAPITSDNISLSGVQYDLIKRNARVPGPNPKNGEEDKFQNGMVKIGTTTTGGLIYGLKTTNYFGEPTNPLVIYLLQEQKDGSSYFSIYLKHGEPIPNNIKNCQTTGGIILVDVSSTDFPSVGFNTTQVVGPRVNLLEAPAYIYTKNKKSFSAVNNLTGLEKNIGTLKIETKNYFLYFHLGTVYLIDGEDAYEYLPSPIPLLSNQQPKGSLQLKKVQFIMTPLYSWWTPECKPAIYLYPQEKTDVNVKVSPKGYLTLTIPEYPEGGWQVTADPSGALEVDGKRYPYLYYESKIRDSEIIKPKDGFVVSFNELPALYNNLLPKLGLSKKEATDFKAYWERVLPKASYYFVGVMSKDTIENIEPLDISPQPSTIIRIRLYFEPLDQRIVVEKPKIVTPARSGFTIVEWGGMVKVDKDHPFTCSQ